MANNSAVITDSFKVEKEEKVNKKLRWAIVGCGGISQTHMGAIKKIPQIEVVGCCDIKPDRLKVMKDQWGIEAGYEKWDDLLREIKPDVIDVCTPNGVHCPAVVAAVEAGCHAITEKPMAMNPAECQQMIDAAKANDRKLAVGFQYRYHPVCEMFTRAKAAGDIGDIMFVKCQALRRRGIPNWGVFGQKKLQGGGPLIDIGVHIIESAMSFLGNPKPVYASAGTWTFLGDKPSTVMSMWPGWDHKTYTVEDFACGQIRFDNGTIMQIEASFADHQKEHDVEDWWAYGTKAGCQWSTSEIYTDQNNMMVNMAPVFMPECGWNVIFQRKLQNWVDGCLKGTPLYAPGEIGLNVQKILCGLYDSAKAGHEIRIKD